MTAKELETRLDFLERQMAVANPKDLPSLNATYQKVIDRLVALDLAGATVEVATKHTKPEGK